MNKAPSNKAHTKEDLFFMKRWFQNFSYKMQRFMIGRYGFDELSRMLNLVSLGLLVLSLFVPFIYFPALFLMIWGIYRTYSKKIEKRRKEREIYLQMTGKIKGWFVRQKNIFRDRKTHRYYKCTGCQTYLRVPKGKGKILVNCPKCGTKMTKTT